jgi:hypothetical protein
LQKITILHTIQVTTHFTLSRQPLTCFCCFCSYFIKIYNEGESVEFKNERVYHILGCGTSKLLPTYAYASMMAQPDMSYSPDLNSLVYYTDETYSIKVGFRAFCIKELHHWLCRTRLVNGDGAWAITQLKHLCKNASGSQK